MLRLWRWIRARRRPWTCGAAADAAGISEGRARAIVRGLHAAGLVRRLTAWESTGGGFQPATWAISARGGRVTAPPILIVRQGLVIGARAADDDR
jgi:hypothetical protein